MMRRVKAAVLREACRALHEQALMRFKTHGAYDERGAALWDAGSFIHPDDGDALLVGPGPAERARRDVPTFHKIKRSMHRLVYGGPS